MGIWEMMSCLTSSDSRSPDWCTWRISVNKNPRSDKLLREDALVRRISHPPTNSPLMYTCGIVGQSLGVEVWVKTQILRPIK